MNKLEPTILELSEKKLIGKRMEMEISDTAKISLLWQAFMPQSFRIQNKVDTGYFSLQILKVDQLTENAWVERWAALEVDSLDEIPEQLEGYTLEGGLYAKFIYKGTQADFGETMKYIYTEWLPNSSYELDNRAHFELMGESYLGPDDPESEEEVWISIK